MRTKVSLELVGAKGNRFRFFRYNPNTHTNTRNMDPTNGRKGKQAH